LFVEIYEVKGVIKILLTKNVFMNWTIRNRKRFEGKKYLFTNYGDIFQVKIEDVPSFSANITLDFNCDYCGKPFNRFLESYSKQQNKNYDISSLIDVENNDACPDCQYKKMNETNKMIYGDAIPMQNHNKTKKHSQEFVKNMFILKNCNLLNEYINIDSELLYTCNKHIEKGIQKTTFYKFNNREHGCALCGIEKQVKSQTGDKSMFWKGGKTNISAWLREKISKWKIESMERCGYICVITGKPFEVIHHLYSFSKITDEVFKELNISINKDISEYSNDELSIIQNKCLEIHYRYPFGVCLTKDVHNLFHSLYGKITTIQDFEEFKANVNKNNIGGIQ